MKAKLIFVMAAAAAITTSNLQKADAQSWKLGGNNVPKDTTLGTTNNHGLRIITNKLERLRITSAGNVGMGTQNEGSVLFPAPRLAINSTAGQDPLQAFVNGSTKFRLSQNGGVSIGSAGTPPANGLYVVGNTGIGTTNPEHARLEIRGSTGAAVAMFGADKYGVTIEADNPEIGFNFFYNGGTKTIKAGYASVVGMFPGSGDVYIGNFNGNKSSADFGSITGYQQVVTIKQNGSVGIGTASPLAALHVETSTFSNGIEAFAKTASGNGLVAECDNGSIPYGVLGICSNTSSGFAGYFSGNLHYTGILTGPASDQKLKENIKSLDKVLTKIMQLKPSFFNYKNEYVKMNLPRDKQIGFVAQDVEKVFPELVKTISDKQVDDGKLFQYKAINYIGLIPLLTKAIQEQQEEINELKQTINQLSHGKTTGDNNASAKTTNVTVSNVSIDQNIPNPFTNTTTIGYNIPVNFKSALIIISDNNGKTISQVQLNNAGKGAVNIDAYHLSNGIYNYSLVIDGKTIESKKMVVEK